MVCLVLEGGQGYRGQARLYQSAASGHQPGGHRANVNTVTVSTWTTATTAASSFLASFFGVVAAKIYFCQKVVAPWFPKIR